MATYIVKPGQNLFDVALHLYGTIEGLFDILISNPDINMNSELAYGQELEYHEGFVLNESIVNEFKNRELVPAGGARKVYFKEPDEDLLMIVGPNPESRLVTFQAAGEGTMIVDWGDNTDLERITLTTSQKTIEHYFDSEVDKRRIRIYGNNETLKFTYLDTSGIGGSLVLTRPIVVDDYSCLGKSFWLTGLALLQETYKVSLKRCIVADLLPLAGMDLQELDLTDVEYVTDNVLDDYLEYIVANYEVYPSSGKKDRRPCTVYLTTEPSARGYAAIDTILNESEWNVSDTWKFYINNELYQPNGTDA